MNGVLERNAMQKSSLTLSAAGLIMLASAKVLHERLLLHLIFHVLTDFLCSKIVHQVVASVCSSAIFLLGF